MRALWLLCFLPACFIDAPTFREPDGGAGGDDVDAMFDPCPNAFTIGGAVDGLWDPAEIRLELDAEGTPADVSVDENGDFVFAQCLADGTSYTVSLPTQPPDHECTVFGATGMISGADVSTVNVKCTGPVDVDVGLDLTTDWMFDPIKSLHVRTLSLLAQEVKLTVTADEATLIEVDGSAVASREQSNGIRLAMGANDVDVHVTAGSYTRTYRIQLDRGAVPIVQDRVFKASNPTANDYFGRALAASSELIVVGSPSEDSSTTGINPGFDDLAMNTGAVYTSALASSIFGAPWLHDAFIKASNAQSSNWFGVSVALDGDTLAVGAYVANASAGAVYVFRRTGSTWSEEAIVTAENGDAGDYFGQAVAISGDVLVVGAVGEDSAATGIDGDELDDTVESCGAAYIFRRSGSIWTQEAYLKPSDAVAFDGISSEAFGTNVAVSGDTVAVSAPGDDSSAPGVDGDASDNSMNGAGAVYVFRKTGGSWEQDAYLKASNPGVNDLFGRDALTLHGDVIAVGAYQEDSSDTGIDGVQADDSAPEAGAVYVFRRTGADWSQEAFIKASNTDAGDEFGRGLSVWGDLLAVGAGGESSSSAIIDGDQSNNDLMWSGAVYLFRWNGSSWAQVSYLKPSNPGDSDSFGAPLVLTPSTLVASSQREDSGSVFPSETLPNSGAAFMFR